MINDKFSYSLVKNEEGAFAVRSVVKSYDLDHVTDKDIVSFYKTFSQFASIDTGLLPLNGTGVLAIRSAGHHTQIVTQHAPGLYHVNWGAYEGDSKARTYYLAQPYRVVIGDFENGNLLGARMFYSPYPITSPNNILYHVNLPNINCKGYRGNGVGWICLYLRDDWSSLPFNEKVSRFIERCSGVETYNDANMSETDGPRFYASHGKPNYITDPGLWQTKSEEGFDWTLDEELWIPIKVKNMDDQGKHDDNGDYLTLAMAMLGNYQAYYTDNNIPKLYNIVSRPDLELSPENIAGMFKTSFALAPAISKHQSKDNPYQFTVENREKNGSEKLVLPFFNEDQDEDEEQFFCEDCETTYSNEQDHCTTAYDTVVCEGCLDEYYCYIESCNMYFATQDDNVYYSNTESKYYHSQYDTVFVCDNCSDCHGISGLSLDKSKEIKKYMYSNSELGTLCKDCFHGTLDDFGSPELVNCKFCQKELINDSELQIHNHHFKETIYDGITYSLADSYICQTCSEDFVYCPCGILKQKEDVTACPESTPICDDSGNKLYVVKKCCASCLGDIHENENKELVANYLPIHESAVQLIVSSKLYQNMKTPYVQNHPFPPGSDLEFLNF